MTGAIVFCAVVVTVAFAWGRDSSDAEPAGIVADSVMTPAARTIAASASAAATGTKSPALAPSPQITDASSAAPTVEPATLSATAAPTEDGAWSATPSVSTPAPSTDLASSAAALASSLEIQYGVRIVTEGQDWGSDENEQLRNIGALGAALAGVPASVRSAIASNVGGALTYLSNDGGRTEAGWQPYSNRQANYYSNEDVAGTDVAANQIVLQPGSTAQTIAHEMMHAYQMRGQAPGTVGVQGHRLRSQGPGVEDDELMPVIPGAESYFHAGTSGTALNNTAASRVAVISEGSRPTESQCSRSTPSLWRTA